MDRLVHRLPGTPGVQVCRVPSGKSETLRALAILAQKGEGAVIDRPPRGEDVRQFLSALGKLGVQLAPASDRVVLFRALAREATEPVEIHVEEGGAPARFLLALGALGKRPVRVTGGARLSARPFSALTDALRALGAAVSGGPGLPIEVRGPLRGGRVEADLASESSQFLSALLLVAPSCPEPVELVATGGVASAPYIDLTVEVLRLAGAKVEAGDDRWRVEPGFGAGKRDLLADVDWSGAAAILASAATGGRPVEVPHLRLEASHPDARFAELARELGLEIGATQTGVRASGTISRGGAFDLCRTPDLAPVLAAMGSLAPDGVTVTGAAHLRLKESDRIEHLVAMLREIGVPAEARNDGFFVPGTFAGRTFAPDEPALPVDPRGDHRLVMAAALLGLVRPLVIRNAQVVGKSFPSFFDVFPAGGSWLNDSALAGTSRLTT